MTGKCVICGRNKSQFFTTQMTREEDFMRKGICKITTFQICQIQQSMIEIIKVIF